MRFAVASRSARLAVCLLMFAPISAACAKASAADRSTKGMDQVLEWQSPASLPPLPEGRGLAGAFVGVEAGALLFAGGSHFDKPAWEGGTKHFQANIYVLSDREGSGSEAQEPAWKVGGTLPVAIAHGAAVATARWGVVCLGGTDGTHCQDKVFSLQWDSKSQTVTVSEAWPSLPVACEKIAATVISSSVATTIYVAGGVTQDGKESPYFHSLTIPHNATEQQRTQLAWEPLPTWPGPSRFGAALVTQHNGSGEKVYLFGGKGGENYLNDAYRYDPAKGEWTAVASLPRPALLAPAIRVGQSHIFLFGGSDGHDVDRWQELRDDYHFVSDVLAYETITDTWTSAGTMPTGVATTTAVEWQGGLLIPGGELRPSVRTAELQLARLRLETPSFGVINFAVLGLYFVGMLGVGWYFSKSNHSTDDYFLAGGRIPWWAAGLSLLATQVSSIGFLAIPAKSFATNWTYFAGVLTWFIVVPIVTYVYIPFLRSLNVTTAYEYLEARFNYAARLIAAVAFSLLQLGRMSVVLLLPAIALAAVTGMDVTLCILIMGAVATTYTVAGGLEADVWSDVVQAVLMVGGAIICVVIVVMETSGGWSEVWHQALADGKWQMADFGTDPTQAVLWVIIVGNILNRLSGLTADQTVVQRFLSTNNAASASRALWLDVAVSIPWAIIVFTLGTALYVFYKNRPELMSPTTATDAIVPLFIAQQLPAGLGGLIVAAVFAAAMSTLDSSMHSVATVYVTDVHKRFRPDSTDRSRLILARYITAAVGCFGTGTAMIMATVGVLSLWDVFLAIVGAVAGVMAGLFLLGMFTTRANGTGAVVGTIVGTVAMIYVERTTNISFFLYPLVGIGGCFIAGYLASLVLPGQSRLAGLTVFTRAGADSGGTPLQTSP